MSELITRNDIPNIELQPVEPRIDFTIRTATPGDFGWIDAMQKQESDKLGFLMRAAIEKRIEQGNVLVAEATPGNGSRGSGLGSGGEETSEDSHGSGRDPKPETLDPAQAATPLGYCIHVDRYMKQDHVGQFIQLNVPPEYRRSLVGAALVKAAFEKSAYGVKLYGLWCRQDLAANRFWEALGFVPLAFRAAGVTTLEKIKRKTGSTAGGVHIYWQRRVREGDHETPHWFPYETSGGMMAESRLVLPIPLGTHWSDAKPVVLPGAERRAAEARLLEAAHDEKYEQDKAALAAKRKAARDAAKEAKRLAQGPKVVHGVEITSGGAAGVPMGFDLPPEAKAQRVAEEKAAAAAAEKQRIKEEKRAAKRAAKQQRRKTDPELLAYGRELRDRWQEAVTAQPGLLLPDGSQDAAKYDVGRLLAGGPTHAAIGGCGEPSEASEALEIVSEVVPEARRLDAA